MNRPYAIIAAIVFVAGGYAYVHFVAPRATTAQVEAAFAPIDFTKTMTGDTQVQETHASSITLMPPRVPPAGAKVYQNAKYRFSLFYPQELSVKEYDEGGEAMTITFQNIDEAKGFQLFIVPYSGASVTGRQFLKDEPSGILRDPKNTDVGNTFATQFFGQNASLGETFEVWFIKNGYLYEASTTADLTDLLTAILTTWQFV